MSIIHYSLAVGDQFAYRWGIGVISGGRGYSRSGPVAGSMTPDIPPGETAAASWWLLRATMNSPDGSVQASFRDSVSFEFAQPFGATQVTIETEGWPTIYTLTWNGSSYILAAPPDVQAFWQYLDDNVGNVLGMNAVFA